ncbi:VOC family protein [Gimesia sp.]|uniref:VOC family protein n=1 Tax=Gimesia sp. TaxID=2024833 RepID=UPI003A915176
MGELNSKINRAVWIDIPVANLERAAAFYEAVLNTKVHIEQFNELQFGVLDHEQGNGGCLILNAAAISSSQGILVYMNVDQRIRDAVTQVESQGGKIIEPIHSIGPHGFRAIILDSEGNRLALHSNSDT